MGCPSIACAKSLLRFLHYAPSETLHISLHRLRKGQSFFGCKGQDCLGLELPEVKVGHAFGVVLEHDIAIFGDWF